MSDETLTEPRTAETLPLEEAQEALRRDLATRYGPGVSLEPPAVVDEDVRQAIRVGLFVQAEKDAHGNDQGTDRNFPGGEVVAVDGRDEVLLQVLRGSKEEWARDNELWLRDQYNPEELIADPTDPFVRVPRELQLPQGQAVSFYDRLAREGVSQGIFKIETGPQAAPDTLFSGDQVIGTSETSQEILNKMRGQLINEARRQYGIELTQAVEVGDPDQRGFRAMQALREAMERGEVDLRVVPGPAGAVPKRPKSGSAAAPSPDSTYEVVPVQDRARRGLSEAYAGVFAEIIHDLTPEEASQFNQNVRSHLEPNLDEVRKMAEGRQAGEAARQQRLHQARERLDGAAEREAAHAEALTMAQTIDHEVVAQQEVHDRFQKLIAAEPDVMKKQALAQERNAAVAVAKERAKQQTRESARVRAETAEVAAEALRRAKSGETWHDTITRTVEDADSGSMESFSHFDEVARERRQQLGLEAIPFLELKKGGLLGSEEPGPKIVESYFRIPGNDHLVVVERYRRSGRDRGELLSQTIMTSRDPIRERRGGFSVGGPKIGNLPPRELDPVIQAVRAVDADTMRKSSGSSLGGSVREYFSGVSTRAMEDVYRGYAADRGDDPLETRDRLNAFRLGASKRRGGFWYWLTRGRV